MDLDKDAKTPNELGQETEFSRTQIRLFAHGQLTNQDTVDRMAAQLELNPDGPIARYLKHIERRSRRILDPSDSIFFSHSDAS